MLSYTVTNQNTQGGEPMSRSCANNNKYHIIKENALGPGEIIRYIWSLKSLIFTLLSAAGQH